MERGNESVMIYEIETMTVDRRAMLLAMAIHAGHMRRDGNTPYITHLKDTARRVESFDEKAVAWLHDSIEDNKTTEDSLRLVFPSHIVDAIVVLTKTRQHDYAEYLSRVKENNLARSVKIADMLSNLSDAPTKKQIRKYASGLLFLTMPGSSSSPAANDLA